MEAKLSKTTRDWALGQIEYHRTQVNTWKSKRRRSVERCRENAKEVANYNKAIRTGTAIIEDLTNIIHASNDWDV